MALIYYFYIEGVVLNRIRYALNPVANKVWVVFASTGLTPNFWTVLAVMMSGASGITYMFAGPLFGFHWYSVSVAGSILVLVSGFFDVIDGGVARVTNRTSKKGSYLDSIFDKVSEAIIFIGIAVGYLANPILCEVALALSLLVSYTRAKAESIGIELKGVGIGERAERLLILGLMGLLPFEGALQLAVILVCIVAVVTLGQRIFLTLKNL
jgi:archaetidylinositol phosphate synthase